MATAKDIRRRIRTVKNIEKITAAMKMVAAARLRKAQELAESARPYATKMKEVMSSLAANSGDITHPLLEVREPNNVGYLVVGGERGLAGSYNVSLTTAAMKAIGTRPADNVDLVVVGKKAIHFFNRQRYRILDTLEIPSSGIPFADVARVTGILRSMFEDGQLDEVNLVYSKFVSPMVQQPVTVKLLPMETVESDSVMHREFIFEPDAAQLLSRLLPRYLETLVYQALVEAQASEQGARMTAMSAATKNAGEMIHSLSMAYNKARQAGITREILEIVSGAEALK